MPLFNNNNIRQFKMYGIVGTSVETNQTVYYANDGYFSNGISRSSNNGEDYLVKPYLTTELSSAKSAKTRAAARFEREIKDVKIVEVDLNYNL